MTLVVRELDDAAKERWEAYVAAHPQATFFHRPGWKHVTERSFGHQTHYLYAERDGEIRGVLPLAHYKSRMFGNALISNGGCSGGGPIASDDDAYAALDARAVELMRELGAAYVEYRQPAQRHPDWQVTEDLHATFSMPLDDEAEDQLKRIPKKQRWAVRKLIDSDMAEDCDDGIDRFYGLYALSLRNLGTPVFSKAYFRNLRDEFGADCDMLTATKAGRPVAWVIRVPAVADHAPRRRTGLSGVRLRPQQDRHRGLCLQKEMGLRHGAGRARIQNAQRRSLAADQSAEPQVSPDDQPVETLAVVGRQCGGAACGAEHRVEPRDRLQDPCAYAAHGS